MLITFRVSNYRSFREEVTLSFVASRLDEGVGTPTPIASDGSTVDLLPVIAVLGANASGKSNLLRAMSFMRDMVLRSATRTPQEPLTSDPFLLDPAYRHAPTLMELEFATDGKRFLYGFEFDELRITGEWLHTFPFKGTQVLFDRDDQDDYQWGKNLPPRTRTLAELTRPDVLFLSLGAQMNNQLLTQVYFFFVENLIMLDVPDRGQVGGPTIRRLQSKKTKTALKMIAMADLGIIDARVTQNQIPEEDRAQFREFLEERMDFDSDISAEQREIEINAMMQSYERSLEEPSVELVHKGMKNRAVPLPFAQESLGTKSWISFTAHALDAIESGGTLLVDELDASLHPILLREAIELFQSPANIRGAQLVFTTHDVTLLGRSSDDYRLSRGQIWMVQKLDGGDSVLIPLTEYKPRKGEDIANGYLQGRYGGTPRVARNSAARIVSEAVENAAT